MTNYTFISIIKSFRSKLIILSVLCLGLNSCFKDDPQLWSINSQEQLAGAYIYSNPEQFSEFIKLIEFTSFEALLNVRGPYTIFLPDNEAMRAYYLQKNVSSLDDFSEAFRDSLIKNHILPNVITTNDIGLGALRYTNALSDYIATEFHGSDIYLNKYSKITKRDIRTANGYIDIIDKVLDPLAKDIYTLISDDPSYKIFTEGLKLTGLKDTLSVIFFPYGKRIARTRFTVLAVPDTIYERYGINNVDDLIEWCDADPDSVTYISNSFYRYMEYHCLTGSYFLSDWFTSIFPVLSRDNNVSIAIEEDYKINIDKKTREYTGFIVPACNTPAKNGALHAIDDLLPVIQPEPTTIIFETTDFFDLKQGDYYQNYYMKWSDGENTFEKIKWKGDYFQYYFKSIQSGIIDHDLVNMLGWWDISITFPKVMKGKYAVSIFQPAWNDVTNCAAYIDGVLTPFTYTGPYAGGSGGLQKIADVNFTTTAEHTIRLRNVTFGGLFWDYVRFDPVN